MTSIEESDRADGCWIFTQLWTVVGSIMDEVEPSLEALGISAKAFFLLIEVAENPFPATLARKMHLPPPTVTYLVKQLEEKGLLSRHAESGDLRKFRLVPTPGGLQAIRKGSEALTAIAGERVGRVATADLAVFARVIQQLAPARGEKT